MQQDSQLVLLEQACSDLREALSRWDATSVGHVGTCRTILDRVATTIGTLQPPPPDVSRDFCDRLRARLLALKASAAQLERLVDGASAFLRIVTGANASLAMYAPDGRPQPDMKAPGSAGLQA